MKRNLMSVLILALLIVNIVINSIVLFSVTGTNRKTAELVDNIVTAMNLQLTIPGDTSVPKKTVSLENTATYSLSSTLTIPLASDTVTDANGNQTLGRQNYIMIDVTLSMDKKSAEYKKYGETIAEREPLIIDAINSVITTKTETECRGQNFDNVKDEILRQLQELFGSDFIYKVSISNVKFG